MEGIIIFLLLAILALPVILLVWVKTSTSSLIREGLNKLNALIIKVDNLEIKEKESGIIVEEEPIVINENLLTLMDPLPEEKDLIIKEEEVDEEKTKTSTDDDDTLSYFAKLADDE